MASKKILIVGNWKMYVTKPEEAKKFASGLRRKAHTFSGIDIVLAPSFTLLPLISATLQGSDIRTSAQSVSVFDTGAHTGEVAAQMVKSFGATHAIVGHSERRAMGEDSKMVRAELERALEAGLVAILCIGESERDPGGAYLSYIVEQISSALDGLAPIKPGRLVIAYEPVWAIGKSAADAMKGTELREMSIFIKKTLTEHMDRAAALKVPILYGGAVEASNARELLEEGDVSGLLVGHASAELESFTHILQEVSKK
jgi:triosephosphate isomerase (TIM)